MINQTDVKLMFRKSVSTHQTNAFTNFFCYFNYGTQCDQIWITEMYEYGSIRFQK